jgi:hypothetical protein
MARYFAKEILKKTHKLPEGTAKRFMQVVISRYRGEKHELEQGLSQESLEDVEVIHQLLRKVLQPAAGGPLPIALTAGSAERKLFAMAWRQWMKSELLKYVRSTKGLAARGKNSTAQWIPENLPKALYYMAYLTIAEAVYEREGVSISDGQRLYKEVNEQVKAFAIQQLHYFDRIYKGIDEKYASLEERQKHVTSDFREQIKSAAQKFADAFATGTNPAQPSASQPAASSGASQPAASTASATEALSQEEIRNRVRNLRNDPTLDNYNKVYELLSDNEAIKKEKADFEAAVQRGLSKTSLTRFTRLVTDVVRLRYSLFGNYMTDWYASQREFIGPEPNDLRFPLGKDGPENLEQKELESKWWSEHKKFLGQADFGHDNKYLRAAVLAGRVTHDLSTWMDRRPVNFSETALALIGQRILNNEPPIQEGPHYVQVLDRIVRGEKVLGASSAASGSGTKKKP